MTFFARYLAHIGRQGNQTTPHPATAARETHDSQGDTGWRDALQNTALRNAKGRMSRRGKASFEA
jgi:hypothetical protein